MRRSTILVCSALCLAEFVCLGALVAPLTTGISMKIGGFALRDHHLDLEDAKSHVLWLGAGGALLSNVLFGWLGDRRVRAGRSRSVLVGAGAVVGLAGLTWASASAGVAELAVSWTLAQVGYNVVFAGLYGLLADLVGPEDRRTASAWFAGSAVGSIAVIALVLTLAPRHAGAVFLPLGIASVPICLLVARLLARPAGPRAAVPPAAGGAGRAFWLLWAQRLLAQASYGFATAYGVEFLLRRTPGPLDADKLDRSLHRFALFLGIGSVAGLVLAVTVAAVIVRRVGQRAVMVAGSIGLLVANVLLVFGSTTGVYGTALILAGIGAGTYFAGDLAAILAVVPPRTSGRYLGIFNVARTLPQTLVPIVGPWLLAVGTADPFGAGSATNYAAFFAAGSAVALAALLMIPMLTLPGREAPVRALQPQAA